MTTLFFVVDSFLLFRYSDHLPATSSTKFSLGARQNCVFDSLVFLWVFWEQKLKLIILAVFAFWLSRLPALYLELRAGLWIWIALRPLKTYYDSH